MPRCVQPGHHLAATLLKGARRYRAKLCPSHRFCSRKKCLVLGRVNYRRSTRASSVSAGINRGVLIRVP